MVALITVVCLTSVPITVYLTMMSVTRAMYSVEWYVTRFEEDAKASSRVLIIDIIPIFPRRI
jgi:hypothetical protein